MRSSGGLFNGLGNSVRAMPLEEIGCRSELIDSEFGFGFIQSAQGMSDLICIAWFGWRFFRNKIGGIGVQCSCDFEECTDRGRFCAQFDSRNVVRGQIRVFGKLLLGQTQRLTASSNSLGDSIQHLLYGYLFHDPSLESQRQRLKGQIG